MSSRTVFFIGYNGCSEFGFHDSVHLHKLEKCPNPELCQVFTSMDGKYVTVFYGKYSAAYLTEPISLIYFKTIVILLLIEILILVLINNLIIFFS